MVVTVKAGHELDVEPGLATVIGPPYRMGKGGCKMVLVRYAKHGRTETVPVKWLERG